MCHLRLDTLEEKGFEKIKEVGVLQQTTFFDLKLQSLSPTWTISGVKDKMSKIPSGQTKAISGNCDINRHFGYTGKKTPTTMMAMMTMMMMMTMTMMMMMMTMTMMI